MALDTKLTNAQASRAADAVTARLNSGFLRLYAGTRPATADTALGGGNTLLAELTFASTAFGAAVNGVATANAIGSDSSANATGTATFARTFETDGTTAVFDCSVGTSGANVNLNTTSIVTAAAVSISAFTYTHPTNGS
jgi:hypothetical protein